MKRKVLLTAIAIMTLGCSIPVYAQPKTMPDGTLFDAEYYANTYPDVKAAFGNDEKALYNHYVQYGKAEGRLPVYTQPKTMPDGTLFDAEYYADTYPDVKAVFGNDEKALYNHYVQYGKAEGRLPYAGSAAAGSLAGKQTTDSSKTVVSRVARLHPQTKETEFWITTYSDGLKMRETNKAYFFHNDFPEQYFIPRTDFSDGLLDVDGNGIDDRDPYNSCGYSDLDFNCVSDERQAYVRSINPDTLFAGPEIASVYHKCSHGVVAQAFELCAECQASVANSTIRAE